MRCDRCGREAVHFQPYSGLRLCGEHLGLSLGGRAKRTIRDHGWIRPGDRIAAGLSGGPCSGLLLRFLSENFGMRRDLSLVAITVDEGAGSGRDMARIRAIAEGMGIEWAGVSPGEPDRETIGGISPAGAREDLTSPRARLRDRSLSSLALELGATKLALATTLDDEARGIFLRVIRGEAARLLEDPGEGRWGIPVIRPFSRIPEEELLLQARLTGIDSLPAAVPGSPGSLEAEAGQMLLGFTRRHPSALFSLAGLGEALARQGSPGRGGPRPSGDGKRGPAPRNHGRVTGHG